MRRYSACGEQRLQSDRVGDAASAALVLVRPGRELLQGEVEVDETYIGGEEPGLRGGRQKGKKVLIAVAVAVERRDPRASGAAGWSRSPTPRRKSLRSFLTENVEPGASVISDGWPSYPHPRPTASTSIGR